MSAGPVRIASLRPVRRSRRIRAMVPTKETWPREEPGEGGETGGGKVNPEYLPRSEKEKQTMEILHKGWRDISDALDRGDAAEAERLRERFNTMLIEMGAIEKELDERALMETMKMYIKPDREAADTEVEQASDEEAAEIVDEILEDEAERETRGLHRGRPGQN